MEKLSVVIITFNEESNIGRCIDSVAPVADEIVVLDSFSTDLTVEIAKSKGARVILHKFTGYVSQKNRALSYATHKYVLSLDADEMLDPILQLSISRAKRGFAFMAYRMKRCAFYCDRYIRHGSWYPEPKVRLFNREVLNWDGIDPHDYVRVSPTTAVYDLKGEILHFICRTVEEHRIRADRFASISAQAMFRDGQKTNWFKILASPFWFFLNDYFIRRGFLNGRRGWQIACIQTRYHFFKYYRLWKLQRQRTLRVVAGGLADLSASPEHIHRRQRQDH